MSLPTKPAPPCTAGTPALPSYLPHTPSSRPALPSYCPLTPPKYPTTPPSPQSLHLKHSPTQPPLSPTAQAKLIGDVNRVAAAIIALRSAYPRANISAIISRTPKMLLKEPQQLAEDAAKVGLGLGALESTPHRICHLPPSSCTPWHPLAPSSLTSNHHLHSPILHTTCRSRLFWPVWRTYPATPAPIVQYPCTW